MDLFLIRHTKAADGALYGDDVERPLTHDGRRAALDVGESLARHGVKLDVIWSSPLVRAVETAELVAVSVGYTGGLEIARALAPEGRPSEILGMVLEQEQRERVALVGHEPSMGNLLSALIGRPGLSLSKGAVVRLRYEAHKKAQVVWMMKPKQLDPSPSLDGL
ncbi:MAG TPA: phosphohistidine phosphatase SixA [Polyangia bacterium]|nr:phosphohistidine phosphatase SixA [Polyangia bacterium]